MTPRERLYLTSIVILAAGLAAAILIYFNAGDDSAEAMEEIVNSKMYLRQLQVYGGKASVVFGELMRWFGALWHGRQLALTILCLSALASAGVFLYALRNPPATGSGGSSEGPASPPREGR